VFYALALNEAVDLSDKTYARQLKAAAILQRVAAKQPNHPGVPHYIIHSYDFAPICREGLPAAQRYAELAPAAPHALHMPSHTFSMLGMWEESIAANLKTLAASRDYAAKNNLDGTYAAVPHSYDFIQYAYLQLGQDKKARAVMDEVGTIQKVFRPILGSETGLAAVPARYMLERQDWRGAAGLVVPATVTAAPAKAITHFARALGAARAGDFVAAQADLAKLEELRASLSKPADAYWSGQVEVQILAAHAWLAHGQGDKPAALQLMRAAADREDASEKHVAMENRLYPMRELLADLLLQQGDAVTALSEYEASMKSAPERVRGFYGAAKAAQAAGNKEKALAYFHNLVRLARDADGDAPKSSRRGSSRRASRRLFLLEHEPRFALNHTGDASCQACQQPRQDDLDAHVIFGDVDRPADALRQRAEAELEAVTRPSLIGDPEQRREVRRKLREALPQAAGSFLLPEAVGDGDDQGFRHAATLLAYGQAGTDSRE
jgi:tetratricopeptide (TPR) repeat protein